MSKPHTISYEEFQEKMSKLKTVSDVTNFAKELLAPTLQAMLEAEMENHLGYKKHEASGDNIGNSRNGYSTKKLKTSFGTEELQVPRDRNSEFEPIAVKKYQTIESDLEEKVIAMYAKGMTTRDINSYLQDIYGVEVSAGMVSNITDKILPLINEWQVRPLEEIYVIMYLDGIHFKIRDNGKIVNKCGYTVLGVTKEGNKDLLGIWLGNSEGSKFWLQVLNEIQNRGVRDILICCVDGLKGFSDAIKAIYPNTEIQQCIIHQVRNTMKYIPHRHKKEFCADLKEIYGAPNEKAGFENLQRVKKKWKQYEMYLKSWEIKWEELNSFYKYSQPVRRIIYTTNAVESLHRQFRKVTKTTCVFPNEESLIKLLWLAQRDISKRWNMAIQNWGEIMGQISIMFKDRIQF